VRHPFDPCLRLRIDVGLLAKAAQPPAPKLAIELEIQKYTFEI
jgi:hypothetical protein